MKSAPGVPPRTANRLTTRHAFILLAGLLLSLVVPAKANAELVITFSEVDTSVMATVSGSIDTAGLTMYGSVGLGSALVNPSIGFFFNSGTTDSAGVDMNYYKMLSGPTYWGPGGADAMVSSYKGDAFLINMAYGGYIELPYNYVSGSLFGSSVQWLNASFLSIGLDTGTYTYTWGSGPTADSLIVQIGSGGPTVPEPASIGLAAIGAAALGLHVRFRGSRTKRMHGHP